MRQLTKLNTLQILILVPCGDRTWTLSTNTPKLCFKAFPLEIPARSSWNSARRICNEMNSEIAPMRNEKERMAIKAATNKLDKRKWTKHSYSAVYFGHVDITPGNRRPRRYQVTFDKSIVKPGGYSRWDPGQPDYLTTDRCNTAMVYNDFTWNNIPCTNSAAVSFFMVGVVCAKRP